MKLTRGYARKIETYQKDGRLGNCTCWDCLRSVGITPHLTMRDRYPRLHPRTIFGVDPEGRPVPVGRGDGTFSEEAGKNAEERAHLRAAVRNREAI